MESYRNLPDYMIPQTPGFHCEKHGNVQTDNLLLHDGRYCMRCFSEMLLNQGVHKVTAVMDGVV